MANEQIDERFSLRVQNLPAALSTNAITSLLSHYGAICVRVLQNRNAASSGKESGTKPSQHSQKAVAVFSTRAIQQNAQQRLNSLELAGHRLLVETFGDGAAKQSKEKEKDKETGGVKNNDIISRQPPLPIGLPPPLPRPALLKLSYTPAPLAPHLGFNYAPSPLLAYKYPKATESIVCNIANALIALPRFYTQVLHLMNKMHLPPPFKKDAIPGRFTLKNVVSYENETKQWRSSKRRKTDSSHNTQMVEEDEEDREEVIDSAIGRTTRGPEAQPQPEPHQLSEHLHNRATLNKTDREPSHRSNISFGELLGKPLTRPHKLLSRSKSTFHAAFRVRTEDHQEAHRSNRLGVISTNEVNRQRITPEEISKEPLMESYVRGLPSSKIIVKNVAREVDEKDLRWIFGYVLPMHMELDLIKIKLLSARCEAIIEFPDQQVATAAVNVLHGVQLEGKTLIVAFHNSAEKFLTVKIKHWTLEELARKRLSDAHLILERAMKNYQRGEPSCSLYVKNLAKTVVLADLIAVFGAVLPHEFGLETLAIHHFTEGRLKCQAFVTYPTVDVASSAMLHVHGVVLKDKPMIVCFRKFQKTQR
ncbi:putative RNA recognition motif domain, nucleotide-binding alpha-beta plait domain superfamily [Plasmopara halstedii]